MPVRFVASSSESGGRWTPRRKTELLEDILHGLLTPEEAMRRHWLSAEELETSTRNYRAHGKAGLRAIRRHREDRMSLRVLYDEFCSLRLT